MEVKKRGRKPKNKFIINDNPIFDNQNDNNIIIKLNANSNPDNGLTCDLNNDTDDFLNFKDTQKYKCMNCNYDIHNNIGMPCKYIEGVFYLYGHFCSFECSTRYCFDNNHYNKYEIYSLINLYHNKLLNSNDTVNIAENKCELIDYGGTLTIEEYRSSFIDTSNINNYIRVKILNTNNKINTPQLKNINNLKLFRKKSTEKNIYQIMNTN